MNIIFISAYERKDIFIMEEKNIDIDLRLSMDTGMKAKTVGDISDEEKQIALKNGRDVYNQERNNSVAAGVANFRLISR